MLFFIWFMEFRYRKLTVNKKQQNKEYQTRNEQKSEKFRMSNKCIEMSQT